MKKAITIFIILFYVAPFLLTMLPYIFEEADWNPMDYARITDVDYKAVLVDEPGSQGKVIITEKLTFDIHAASKNNPFWELWRDLPEDYIDGVKVDYRVNSVKQIVENGPDIIYQESPQLYWEDEDYVDTYRGLGPGKWFHSEGPYNETARQYECVMLYIDGIYREKVTFEIEYEMYNAALRYNDCSELYLSMYSEETIKHLNSYKGQILIPNKDMPRAGCYEAHTYGTNSNSFQFSESTTLNPGYHTFFFSLDESDLKFRPYNEYIEFALVSYGIDKHVFTEYASHNNYYNHDVLHEIQTEQLEYDTIPDEYNESKFVIFLICFGASIVILKVLLEADDKIEHKYNFYTPSMEMDYFRDIPSNLDPYFASNLVFCKDKKPKDVEDSYAAIMLSLVRKNYIELTKIRNEASWTFHNVKIVVKHKPIPPHIVPFLQDPVTDSNEPELEPLTLTEQYYFNLIVKHSYGTEISMSNFQSKISADYQNTDTFVKNIENSVTHIGVTEGYFQKANFNEPRQILKSKSKTFKIWGFIFLIIVNLISYQTRYDLAWGGYSILGITFLFGSYIYKKLSNKYILLTQFGQDEYVKWRGLYNFLNSETLMSERTVIELPLWEQYLVYATAFGISDKVIAALNIRCPDIDTSSMLSNPYYRSKSFYSRSRSFRTTAHHTSHSFRSGGYSGGYGGHGGYGGGGRGGGGGGGGH